jgi:hypothetical protein
MLSLAACSGLQEISLDYCGGSPHGRLVVPEQVLCSTALTKLVLTDCDIVSPLAVCDATQLRHLEVSAPCPKHTQLLQLSSVMQLTSLGLSHDASATSLSELPSGLGFRLPQLQVLDVSNTHVSAFPPGLERLTCLRAAKCLVTSVAAVSHLVGLKVLQLQSNLLLAPPYDKLSVLTALQDLSLSIWN